MYSWKKLSVRWVPGAALAACLFVACVSKPQGETPPPTAGKPAAPPVATEAAKPGGGAPGAPGAAGPAASAGEAAPAVGTAPAGAGAGAPSALTLPEGYRVVEKTLAPGEVARVAGKAVTTAELKRQVARLTEVFHQQRTTVTGWRQMALGIAADGIVMDEYVAKLGGRNKRAVRMHRQGELMALQEVYFARDILPKMTITPEQIAVRLPRSREEVFMRFLPFAPEAQKEVLADLQAGVPFEQLQKKYSSSGEGMGLHGDIGYSVRGKTFFSEEDEAYLWGLAKGAISRPVESPIGPMLVRVEDRRLTDDATWSALENTARQQVASERSAAFTDGLLARHTVKTNYPGIREAAAAILAGDRMQDRLVGTVDDVEVWLLDLDGMLEGSYIDTNRAASADDLLSYYTGMFESVGKKIAIGLEAEKAGFALGEHGERKVAQFRRLIAAMLVKEELTRGIVVPEAEARADYDRAVKQREGNDHFVVGLLQAPDLGTALKLRKGFESGTPFEKLHELAPETVKPARDYVFPGEKMPQSMQEEAAQVRPGQLFTLFPTGKTYNVALLRGRKPRVMPPYEKVRGEIMRRLQRDRGNEELVKLAARLRAGVIVDVDRAQFDAIPEPPSSAKAMPMGHGSGGGHGKGGAK
ncbi:MAG TPA: peptidylprolyl isomerase [Candidatus Methanoperedens sp.]|nr:peptidylprolyl isomerase [Candidatus Methanoperedens sp.]